MRFLLALVFVASCVAFADGSNKNFSGLTKLKSGNEIFVDYSVAKEGMPTVVFVNGLTFTTRDYYVTAHLLIDQGYGVLLYDPTGMGQTLLANPMPKDPIKVTSQTAELDEVMSNLNVPAPYNLFGLSYGGGILTAYATTYPDKVKTLMMLSPYTEVIDASKSLILNQIKQTRVLFPYNKATDEELANYFIRQFVYQTYPILEPVVLENPYKLEGIAKLVQGITPYRPIDDAVKLPAGSVHMMIGAADEYVKKPVYDDFWKVVAPAAKCSYTSVDDSKHKISSIYPYFVSRWINFVMTADTCKGLEYTADPFLLTMTNDKKTIKLPEFKK